jgi:serine/threonine protein kinase
VVASAPPPSDDDAAVSSANHYAILAKLATGGMAELFLARTTSTGGVERYVVLKRVLPNKLADHDFVTMFLDEARLVAQLQHPNIAQVFDTGRLGESYFFSMEYVHGETVRELVARAHELGRPIPLGCTLTIIASAAAGLHHAHEKLGLDGVPLGIVHRDVSPSNLLVSFEGNVKLVDFGVAKATTKRSVDTADGRVKGKIGYLSPEQCRGRTSDRRSDLFSLGIVMWELLVGERLFKRDNDYDTMEAIAIDPIVAPSRRRPEVPPALDAIVVRLLAKAPGDRYQNAEELGEELERVAELTGARISTASLKRFVFELFGKRAEPWIEVQHRHAAAEVITVSAAAGIDTLVTVADAQLSRLIDLTHTRTIAEPPRHGTSPPRGRSRRPVVVLAAAALIVAVVLIAPGLRGHVPATARQPIGPASTPRTSPVLVHPVGDARPSQPIVEPAPVLPTHAHDAPMAPAHRAPPPRKPSCATDPAACPPAPSAPSTALCDDPMACRR